jgi:protease I
MTRIAILAESPYEDLELWYPYYRLKEAGIEAVLVGPTAGSTYVSKHGYPAVADLSSADARAEDFDGVIVPGGFAPDRMRRDPAMRRLVADLDAAGKLVAGICHAGWMLISAQVVKGRKVTSVGAIRDDMENAGGLWLNQEVVVDRNLITSRTPADLPPFMKAILGFLGTA